MKALSSRTLFIHALGAILAFSSACGGIHLMEPKVRKAFDSQACVEAALRGKPDRDTLVQAFDHFNDGCTAGKPAACSTLGVMVELGLAVPRNEGLAVSLYQRACSAGNNTGCVNLARAYTSGTGVPKNIDAAISLLSSTCSDGDGPACGELGIIYQRGKGVARDDRYAAQLFDRACEDDHVRSCFELATLYDDGKLGTDTLRMITLYEEACVGGVDPACDRLPGAYTTGRNPTPPSHPRKTACELGDALACTAVGLAYYNGDGVPKDVQRGAGYLQMACDGGYAPSCAVLRPMLHGACARGKGSSCRALATLVK